MGSLACPTTEQDLRQLFEPYGTVETIRIMTDRETGRSRGFGFVEMPTATRRAVPLTPSTARTSLAAPSRSTKHGRENRDGNHASRAGRGALASSSPSRWPTAAGTPSRQGVAHAGTSAATQAPAGTPGVWAHDPAPQPF
ncbi:MAG TPA: hypothetical protein VLQ80_01690 [Candidatus Saccharimonadia bacterium]|nr:hypothetical protein [Candidatus Saccharimonadia bacterium]